MSVPVSRARYPVDSPFLEGYSPDWPSQASVPTLQKSQSRLLISPGLAFVAYGYTINSEIIVPESRDFYKNVTWQSLT